MDKIEKIEVPDNRFRAHCFPELHGETVVNGAGKDASCDPFQPLYDSGSDESAYRPSCILSSYPNRDQHDDSSERQHQSYSQGIIAGQRDAQCLLQEEMGPGLQEFVLATSQLGEQLGHLTKASSRSTIHLALEIVHKILGDHLSLDAQNLASVHQEVAEAMHRAYGINLRLNTDDFENYSAMLQCESALPVRSDGVRLAGDSRVDKGSISLKEVDPKLSVEPITQKLSQVLDRFQSP